MTGSDASTQDTRPAVTTHPLLGVAGVLLGALIATCTGRLISAGLRTFDVHCISESLRSPGSTPRSTAPMLFIVPFSVYLACCVSCLAAVSFMPKAPTQYRQVTAAPGEAK